MIGSRWCMAGRSVILLAAVSVLCACGKSTLSVTVSSLDPVYLEKYRVGAPVETVVARARQAEGFLKEGGVFSPQAINGRVDEIRDAIDAIVASESQIGSDLRRALADRLKSKVGETLSEPIRRHFFEARERLSVAVREVRTAQKKSLSDLEDALELYLSAGRTFASVDGTVVGVANGAREELKKDFPALLRAISDEKRAKAKQQLNTVADLVVQRIEEITEPQQRASRAISQDLLGDPLLGYVLKAPDQHWTGLLNLATAHVVGTNSDLAIVMDDVGKFSVKGIRADSTAATAATFTTLSTVMNIAAVAAGVPVPGLFSTPKAADGENPKPDTTPLVSRTQVEQEGCFARQDMVRLLQIVLSEGQTTLDSQDDTVVSALRTRVAGGLRAFVGPEEKE